MRSEITALSLEEQSSHHNRAIIWPQSIVFHTPWYFSRSHELSLWVLKCMGDLKPFAFSDSPVASGVRLRVAHVGLASERVGNIMHGGFL